MGLFDIFKKKKFKEAVLPIDVAVTQAIGQSSYNISETTQEELTPHLLMSKVKEIVETRPFVMYGITELSNFVYSGLDFTCEDMNDEKQIKASKWLEKWFNNRKYDIELSQFIFNYLVFANSYLELKWIDGHLDSFYCVPDPSVIYYDTQKEVKDSFWLMSLPITMKKIIIDGITLASTEIDIYKYSPSALLKMQRLNVVRLPKKKLLHLKSEYSPDGYYGYSYLMTCVDDAEAIEKIVRNVTHIANEKAVGKKIISLLPENTGTPVTLQDAIQLGNDLGSISSKNVVTNRDAKVTDLSNVGTYDTMNSELTWLTQDMLSGTIPSYMTPWNSSMSRASAEQARVPFIKRVESVKKQIENFLNDELKEIISIEANEKGIDLDNVFIRLKETQYYTNEEVKAYYLDLYQNNIITLKYLKEKLDVPTSDDDDYYQYQEEEKRKKVEQEERKDDDIFEFTGTDGGDVSNIGSDFETDDDFETEEPEEPEIETPEIPEPEVEQ